MHFDHTQVAYIDLIRVWTENHEVGVHTSELEQSAIYATGEQRIEAELMGLAVGVFTIGARRSDRLILRCSG